jgi:hypothetical protein
VHFGGPWQGHGWYISCPFGIFMTIWYLHTCSFGKFCGHFVFFTGIGMMFQEIIGELIKY